MLVETASGETGCQPEDGRLTDPAEVPEAQRTSKASTRPFSGSVLARVFAPDGRQSRVDCVS